MAFETRFLAPLTRTSPRSGVWPLTMTASLSALVNAYLPRGEWSGDGSRESIGTGSGYGQSPFGCFEDRAWVNSPGKHSPKAGVMRRTGHAERGRTTTRSTIRLFGYGSGGQR